MKCFQNEKIKMIIMVLAFNISEELEKKIEKIVKKAKKLSQELYKKLKEIINNDDQTIDHYKNLRYSFSDRKRVPVGKHFVLIFKYIKEKKHLIFLDFEHQDKIYKRK